MTNLDNLIRKFASQEVLDGISRRMKNAGDEEASLWGRDPTNAKYYRIWKSSERSQELYEKEKQSYGFSRRDPNGNFDNDCFDDPLKEIRYKFKYVWEFKEFLEVYQNYVDDFGNFTQIESSELSFVLRVLDLMEEDYSNWILKEGHGIVNRWDITIGKRIQEEIPAWKMVNTLTGTYADFHTGSLEDDGIINLMFFKITDESKRGNAFFTLKEFREVAQIVMFKQPENVKGFTSIVLQLDDNFQKKIEPWRFKKIGGLIDEQTRLGRYWEAFGGVMGHNIGMSHDKENRQERLYFFNEKLALEIKDWAKENKVDDPYQYAKKTIYRKEIEEKLRSKSI